MDVRLEMARAIVKTLKVRQQGHTWLVPSQSGHGKGYIVRHTDAGYVCDCPDFGMRRHQCKHILATCIVLTQTQETKVPHFNSLFNYLEMPELTPLLQELVTIARLPLKAIETDFAVDSSGFSTCRYTRCFDAKYGDATEQHEWMKVHLMCGVKTNVVTAVEVSDRYGADSPYFGLLTANTSRHFQMGQVSADKAYSSKNNLRIVTAAGATPYIPFKSITTGGLGPMTLWKRMFHYYSYQREAFLADYHKRSNVETTFFMMRAKFGDALRSKTQVAQFNEALLKVLCHNICCVIQSMHELGASPTFWQGQAA